MTRDFVDRILASTEWARASSWGSPRRGHPEGTLKRHVEEQVLPFIDRFYAALDDYWALVALAYLHDIGKPDVLRVEGRMSGDPHSVLSAGIAERLGTPARLTNVIRLHDRPYSYWRRLRGKHGKPSAVRWTAERRAKFRQEFGAPELDLALLVRFQRADNGYRRAPVLDEAVDPVLWFENRVLAEHLLAELPPEGKDQRYPAG